MKHLFHVIRKIGLRGCGIFVPAVVPVRHLSQLISDVFSWRGWGTCPHERRMTEIVSRVTVS